MSRPCATAPREVTLWRLLGVARPELPMLGISGAQMAMPARVVAGPRDTTGTAENKMGEERGEKKH
jgi:hypothetical protein